MTNAMTSEPPAPAPGPPPPPPPPQQRSLASAAARNLATTTKSVPFTTETTPRWLLRMLPWIDVDGATYRVNRRLSYRVGDGRVAVARTGARAAVVPAQLVELPLLRGFDDPAVLAELAGRFGQQELATGERLVRGGDPADRLVVVARGRARATGPGEYGDETTRRVLGPGDHVGDRSLADPAGRWELTVTALTPVTVLTLSRQSFEAVAAGSATLRAHLERIRTGSPPARNKYGEVTIDLAAGHTGEFALPGTFVAYQTAPRELSLSLAQTAVRVHTRIADTYRDPMDQVEQQLRLVREAVCERQEYELLNHPEFGLLHNADDRQCLYPGAGPPTPDDLDQLLARRRRSDFFLAQPRTIAAFGRECNRRGTVPGSVTVQGQVVPAWRGVPILPSDKIPITAAGTSSVLAMRTGAEHQGVVGLRPGAGRHGRAGPAPAFEEAGLSVRRRGVDRRGIVSYLVSAYFSVAVLVPDALGILEHVEIGQAAEERR